MGVQLPGFFSDDDNVRFQTQQTITLTGGFTIFQEGLRGQVQLPYPEGITKRFKSQVPSSSDCVEHAVMIEDSTPELQNREFLLAFKLRYGRLPIPNSFKLFHVIREDGNKLQTIEVKDYSLEDLYLEYSLPLLITVPCRTNNMTFLYRGEFKVHHNLKYDHLTDIECQGVEVNTTILNSDGTSREFEIGNPKFAINIDEHQSLRIVELPEYHNQSSEYWAFSCASIVQHSN